MGRSAFIVSAILLWSAAAIAQPASPACEPVARAMLAVHGEQGIHQRMMKPAIAGPHTLVAEAIMRPEAMFMREAGATAWTRLPLDAARRRTAAEAALAKLPLSDCSSARQPPLAGVVLYDYSQSNPLAAGGRSRGSLWIDAVNGRLLRLVLDDGSYQTFEYGSFAAPSP